MKRGSHLKLNLNLNRKRRVIQMKKNQKVRVNRNQIQIQRKVALGPIHRLIIVRIYKVMGPLDRLIKAIQNIESDLKKQFNKRFLFNNFKFMGFWGFGEIGRAHV